MTDHIWTYRPVVDPEHLAERITDAITPQIQKIAKRNRDEGYAQALRDFDRRYPYAHLEYDHGFIDRLSTLIASFADERGIDLTEAKR